MDEFFIISNAISKHKETLPKIKKDMETWNHVTQKSLSFELELDK